MIHRNHPGKIGLLAMIASACLGSFATAGDSVLVFNEVHYHPAEGQSEFIELINLNGVDVSVAGWKIEGAVEYTFPAGTVVPGGGYVVIGNVPGSLGVFSGSLDNDGAALRLRNVSGRLMDELEYEPGGNWPDAPAGSGASLVRKGLNAASGPGAWTASGTRGGSPGGANFPAPGAVTSTTVQVFDGSWKYDQSAGELPGWNSKTFDDSAWTEGVAPVFFGNPNAPGTPASSITSVGVWSLARWTGDADSQVSAAKTYTHKVDWGHTATQTVVNGVTFDNTPGQSRTGSNWNLTGAPANVTNNTTAPRNSMQSGTGSHQLLTEFFYGSSGTSTEVLELTGLTPGQSYTLTLYCAGWDAREVRRMRVTPSNTGVSTLLDQGSWGEGACTLIKYQYRAPADGAVSIEFVPLQAASWHNYAFTNEVSAPIAPEKALSAATVEQVSSATANRGGALSADGSGINADGNHGTVAEGAMWQSASNGLPASITWGLASPTTLSGLKIWNFNELSDPGGTPVDNTNRGVRDVEIFVSTEVTGENFTSAGNYVVPQAFGCTSEVGSRIGFASPIANVRRVRLVASTNWGDASNFAGLAEVQFLSPGTVLPSNPVTTRFRKNFTLPGFANSTYSLSLRHGIDDGAVFYLNGTEIHRSNISGTVNASTPADSNVTSPVLTSNITLPGTAFTPGDNTLAVELHQASSGMADAWFTASLAVTETAQAVTGGLQFSEIGIPGASFFVEIVNSTGSAVSTSGYSIVSSSGQSVSLPVQSVAPGQMIVFDFAALGFVPSPGAKLYLYSAGGIEVRDSRPVLNRLQGLLSDGRWGYPTSATPGAANVAVISDAIVINEIYYHAPGTSPEQWIELHNKSASPVSVAGWSVADGISYEFPGNTPPIPAGGFVVIAWDTAAFNTLHGFVPYGPFGSSLSGKGETITLLDANGNVADQVTYADGGLWSEWADGGGSSLELRDPDSDNSRGEAWSASDESHQSTWQTITVPTGLASNPNSGDPVLYNEFVFGLLNTGEFLIDDISVKNANVELIQNTDFSSGTANAWRIIGSHSGTVVDDPDSPGNKVLKVSVSNATEHMHNHATTTLKQGAAFHTINPGQAYSISYRAKWLRGSNRLHSRLWHNRLARQTLLNMPATGGTPGAPNGTLQPNIGPTFADMAHSPVIPVINQPATVTVRVDDPDGVAAVQLFRSVNGGAFVSSAMTPSGGGLYSGSITGVGFGGLVHFYVRATDNQGAVSFFPPEGPNARAMIAWQDGRAQLQYGNGARAHNVRVIMPTADATELYKAENLMSDAAVPCTIVYDEREVYYRAGVRLKSSEHGRFNQNRCGYTLEFPSDDLFLGVHDTVAIDRSGGTSLGQKEILLKSLENQAGGVYASEDDIIRVISAVGSTLSGNAFTFTGSGITGQAIMSKTRLDREYLNDQFENGGDGAMFKYERVYVLTETMNPATRNKDASIVPENPKVPQDSTGPPGVPVTSLGGNKESYRWYWLIQNARDNDDYSGLMNVVSALGASSQPGMAQYIDISSWLRATIPSALFGVTDNYLGSGGGQHNALFYFPPGKKAVLIPWDLDFLGQGDPTASLTSGGDVNKFIANPVHRRVFWGHMLDILNRSFTEANMSRWATHYSKFSIDDMTGSLSYLNQRVAYARSQVNSAVPPVAFARTSASPTNVSTPFATISGTAWVDVVEIRLAGANVPLNVTWTGVNTWSLQLPVSPGSNSYTLVAYNHEGQQVGSTSVVVNASGGVFAAGPGNLAVSELHFNPPGSADSTEFIELQNVTASTLDLTGCHFDEENGEGISYSFASGVQVPAGGRIIVARDRAAFVAAYPSASPVAAGEFNPTSLDNGGESIVLYAASGLEIFRFSYTDDVPGTDGDGRSLVRILGSTNPDSSTYEWRASQQTGGNPGDTDAIVFTGNAADDIDGDSFTRLMEYAFGTSDADPGSFPPAPTLFFGAGTIGATFTTVPNADDAIVTIETRPDFDTPWTEYTGPAPAGTSRFFRAKVTPR